MQFLEEKNAFCYYNSGRRALYTYRILGISRLAKIFRVIIAILIHLTQPDKDLEQTDSYLPKIMYVLIHISTSKRGFTFFKSFEFVPKLYHDNNIR